MTKPNYRLDDGEPMCRGEDCDQYGDCMPRYEAPPVGDPCVPGLREQRDEARWELCLTHIEPTGYMAYRGWNLFKEKKDD